MAARGGSAPDPGNLERNDGVVQKRNDPANGPDESHTALARPIHRLRKVERGDDARERFGEDPCGTAALNLLFETEILALLRARGAELVHCRAHFLREAL